MITKDILDQKREEVLRSRAVYQAQVVACDGALKVLDDLLQQAEEPTADEEK